MKSCKIILQNGIGDFMTKEVEQEKTRRYTFRSQRKDGIQVIHNSSGGDLIEATEKAILEANQNDWEFLGRVANTKSAYVRAEEEN